jgi:hypothetical protein
MEIKSRSIARCHDLPPPARLSHIMHHVRNFELEQNDYLNASPRSRSRLQRQGRVRHERRWRVGRGRRPAAEIGQRRWLWDAADVRERLQRRFGLRRDRTGPLAGETGKLRVEPLPDQLRLCRRSSCKQDEQQQHQYELQVHSLSVALIEPATRKIVLIYVLSPESPRRLLFL